MTNKNETLWPALMFLWTWWALAEYSPFKSHAFFLAILYWVIGLLAFRMFGSATHRLGFKGWLLLLQLAVWYGLFLALAPLNPVAKILLIWGIGTPLMFVGAVWRRVYEQLPKSQDTLDNVPLLMACVGLIAVACFAWRDGASLLTAATVGIISVSLAAIPLYYGWRLAARPPRGGHDARFGTEESYRTAGMSDER